jgi:periplasmic protein TonB
MFESALLRPTRRRNAPLLWLTAAGLHLVGIAGILAASALHLPPLPPPPLREAFFAVALPPEPPPAERPTRVRLEATRAAVAPPVRQPEVVPEAIAPPTSAPEVAPASDLPLAPLGPSAGAGGEGSEEGVPGGAGEGDGCIGDCAPAVEADPGPIRMHAAITPPRLVARCQPTYTEAARRVRRQGIVIFEAVIDKDGTIRQARQLSPRLGLGLDESALECLEKLRYEPARLGDRAVSVYFSLTVQFSLQ